jgi:Tfp pilus assembly protein PilX
VRAAFSRLRDESGIALIVALGVTVVLSISVTSAMYYSGSNSRSANVSDKRNRAYSLAEAGINNAMSVLSKPTNNALDKYVLCPDNPLPNQPLPTLPCVHSDPYDNGTVTWSGVLAVDVVSNSAYWTITSIGDVANPTSPTAAHLTRTITATVVVKPTDSQQLNNPSWDYIFSRAPNWTGVALSGCDMTLGNSVNVTANLYVLGNLCLTNTAQMTKGKLYVKGSLDQQSNGNTIGTASLALPEAHIGLGCKYKSQTGTLPHNPCKNGAATTNDNVWATLLDNAPQPISPPVVDWNGWYLNASPGPYYACNATQPGEPALPTFKFDNPVGSLADTDANKLLTKNDNQGIADLTPSTAYMCKTPNGQISWDPGNAGASPPTYPTLTVTGTIFIDGSAKIDNGKTNLYTGSGVLYLSGSFLIKNSKLCPKSTYVVATGVCDTTKWDNQADLLGIVANGNGSVAADNQVSAGDSIQLVSSYMAGAAYATNNIEIGTTSIFDGPLDAASVILGQSSTSTFSGFQFVPVGLPGETTTYAQPQAPTFTGG